MKLVVYAGETLEYSIKKSDILRITHSSGRVEIFNQPVQAAPEREKDEVTMTDSPVDHHNKIAILLFGFLMDVNPVRKRLVIKHRTKFWLPQRTR